METLFRFHATLARGQSARQRKQTCKTTPTAKKNKAVVVEAHVPTDTDHFHGNLLTDCQVAGNPSPARAPRDWFPYGFSKGVFF
jgi:hypothetical protein